MAIEVQMTDDVRKYDTKVIGPFNKRQLMCVLIAIPCALPGVLIPKDIVLKILFSIILATPALLCGWIKYHGMYFEALFFRFLYLHVLTPKKRKYKSINLFRQAEKEYEKKAEREKIKSFSSKERKQYLKNKKKKQTVKYSKIPEYKVYK